MLHCWIIPPIFMSRSGNAARSIPLPPACEERTPRAGSGATWPLPTAASMEPARKPLVAVTRGDFDESARRVGGWGIPVRAIPRPRNAADRQKNPRPLGGGIFRAGVRSPRGGQTAEGMPVRVSACPNAKTAAITAHQRFLDRLFARRDAPPFGTGEKEDPPSSRLRWTSGPSHSARRLCHTRRPSKSSRDLKKSVWEAFLSRIGGIGPQPKHATRSCASLRAKRGLPSSSSQRHGQRHS